MAFDASLTPINAFAGTPSDSARISGFGFYVGSPGDVTVMPSYQEAKATPVPVTFFNCPAGLIVPLVISRLMATGTSASDIAIFGPV